MTSSHARRERAAIRKKIQKDLRIHAKVQKRKAAERARLAAEGKEASPAEGIDVVKRDDLRVATDVVDVSPADPILVS